MEDAKESIRVEKEEKERLQKEREISSKEIENLKNEINELERQMAIIRKHNDELDAQLKSSQAKQTILENELAAGRKEVEILNELNQRLQKERQEMQK